MRIRDAWLSFVFVFVVSACSDGAGSPPDTVMDAVTATDIAVVTDIAPDVTPDAATATDVDALPDMVADTARNTEIPKVVAQPWLTNIGRPWDLAFLPDGTLLVTERAGRVLAADPGSRTTRVILEAPGDLVAAGQSGLLGIAIDPSFTENRFIYIYLASNRAGATDNRVRRFTLDGTASALTEDRDILTGITWGSNGTHSGGRIRFGPDGNLWVTTGDTRSATVPQDPTEAGAKVLRVTRDGAPAVGNPPVTPPARPEVVFTGVRNPQGIAFRPGSGDVFICEHGPNVDDEVTRVTIGGNGGWNPDDGNGRYIGYEGALMSDPTIAGVVAPSFVLADSTGMSACDFVVGEAWQGLDGALVVGLLAGGQALAVMLDADGTGVIGPPSIMLAEGRRLRSIVQGPDGALWVALDEEPGTVWRVTPE